MTKSISLKTLIISFLFLFISASAQIGIGTDDPETSSKLDIFSTTKGFLPPRMSKAQRDAINGGVFAEGLVIYNTDDNCINFYNGTEWINLCATPDSPPPNLPGNITLTGGQTAYIASVYDKNYLPYTAPATVAETGTLSPDGDEEMLVDVQGTLNTTTGLTVYIPYTVTTNPVELPAFSQTRTVISDHIQGSDPESNMGGGTPIDVTFSYALQNLSVGTGNIEATIKAVDNDLNAVKLDINKGIGTDLGLLLAEFVIATNENGTLDTIKLKNIAGIPDRRFGEQTPTGATTTLSGTLGYNHNNLYLPIQAENGRVWLNNNLGANYSDLNSGVFAINQQAMTITDYNAYGSLFQWGRYADGHELITYTASNAGTGDNGITTQVSNVDNPNHSLFITKPSNVTDWRSDFNTNRWQGVNGINNPCPHGFKVPTAQEYLDFRTSENPAVTNASTSYSSILKLTATGQRTNGATGVVQSAADVNGGMLGWTSSPTAINPNDNAIQLQTTTGNFHLTGNSRAKGCFIRCIQDINAPTTIPANMTLSGNKISYIASIDDQDYLPYSVPTGPANQQNTGDGSNDDTHIDIQGVLTTSGQTISIPFTVSGTVSYDAYSYTVNVHDSLTEDGQGGPVNFSYPGGIVSSNGNIIMTIKALGNPINLKKLDLKNGLGDGTSVDGNINSGVFGVLVAEAPILINSSNDTNYVQLRNISGIPDRRFGEETIQGGITDFHHNNLYLPTAAADGKIWLNHNLGANYSNVNHPSFDIGYTITDGDEFNAYGSYYQWGRFSDGHELLNSNVSSSITVDAVNGSTTTPSATNTPNHNDFIYATVSSLIDWRTPTTIDIWTEPDFNNNPCPVGFKIPSFDELNDMFQAEGITNKATAVTKNVRFARAGIRSTSTSLSETGTNVWLWTSTNGTHPRTGAAVQIDGPGIHPSMAQSKAKGINVRCVQHIETPALVPTGVTLSANKVSYVVSINDDDYFPYTAPTGPANQQFSGDGSEDDLLINVQGKLTTTGQTIIIPYTCANNIAYESYSMTVTVDAALTEDGISRDVNFFYPAGTAAAPAHYLTMTVKSIGGDLNLKKLDLKNGLGNGTSTEGNINSGVFGVLVAEVPMFVNEAMDIEYIQLRNVSGIPDRRFGETTDINSVTGSHHNNLYIPIVADDGNTWLNHNLGANYTDLTHGSFSPAKKPSIITDLDAYGSLFQYGRYSDGHELVNFASANSGTGVTGYQGGQSGSPTPSHNKYIVTTTIQDYNWLTSTNNSLWLGEDAPNNPCPIGYRLPTELEMNKLVADESISSNSTAFASNLSFTNAGFREHINTSQLYPGSAGYYMTSSVNAQGIRVRAVRFNNTISTLDGFKSSGYSVRCIKDYETPSTIPANMSLSGNKVSYIASINDNDYLPYTAPTGPANLQTSGDGSADDTHINIQGTLTTTGQTISIPYTVSGSVSYDAYSYTVDVANNLTEDGQGGRVNFSYPAGSTSTDGTITMTIKAVDSNIDLKKLDLTNGLGDGTSVDGHINSDVFGVLVAEVPILINSSNDTNYVQLRNISGIPDRRFGETTTQGNPGVAVTAEHHSNLYLPVSAADGKTWLNNNLGANYSRLFNYDGSTNSNFNPAKQATVYNDYNAYGSLYQWGRYSDGHELITYSNSTDGTPVTNTNDPSHSTTILPNNSTFYLGDNTPTSQENNWLDFGPTPNATEDGLWQGESGPNNPCPQGYRLPTKTEFNTLLSAEKITTYTNAASSSLKFSAVGHRNFVQGEVINEGDNGYYWLSSIDNFSFNFNTDFGLLSSGSVNIYSSFRANGFSVRCIKD